MLNLFQDDAVNHHTGIAAVIKRNYRNLSHPAFSFF